MSTNAISLLPFLLLFAGLGQPAAAMWSGHGFQPLGQWFVYMAVITFTTAFAALARSPAQFTSQTVAGAAATMACAGLIAGSATWLHVSGGVARATLP